MTRRRRRIVDRPRSHERWLVSYADFVTLLFALFTVMYASSTVDARKMSSMVEAMQQVFRGGTPPADGSISLAPPAAAGPMIADRNAGLVDVAALLRRDLSDAISSGRVAVDMDARGVVISVRESGSFVTGSAELPPAAEVLMQQLAARLRAIPNAVRVEGHTDDVPIATARYKSNWELSAARAMRVVEVLMQSGVGAQRLSAAGYSEYRPRVANDSPENRARNRRVDIVILNSATSVAEEPSSR